LVNIIILSYASDLPSYLPVAPCITAGTAALAPPDDPPPNIPPTNDTKDPHIVEHDDKIPEHIDDIDGIRFAHVLPIASAVVFDIKDVHICGRPQQNALQHIPVIIPDIFLSSCFLLIKYTAKHVYYHRYW